MTKGSKMVGAVIGATLAVAGAWYILNHQAAIRAWFQNLGKSLAPTPSTPSGGGTPPAKTAPSATHPTPTSPSHPSTSPVPIIHATYPDTTWNPRTEKIVAGTIMPVDAANLPKSTPTNKIHPTTHTPSPKPPQHQGTIPNVNSPEVNPYVQPPSQLHPRPVTVHHVSPPTQKIPKTPKQPRCTNPKSCNGTSCCHVKCEDIDTCFKPCGWSKDDYNTFVASCINAVNIVNKK